MTFTEKSVNALSIKVDKQRKTIESPLEPLIDRPCEILVINFFIYNIIKFPSTIYFAHLFLYLSISKL